jgi:cleavage and polyadenylation specificity factor subunit 2
MASINVQPIVDPSGEARCFLLECEECTILLDVGCDDKFSPSVLDAIARLKNRVDVILLSHPDVQHLGALPYLMGKMGMRAQVYSTLPVKKMGHLTMYDAWQSLKADGLAEDLPFDIEDVDTAFDSPLFKTLQYTERHNLTGNGEGISITAYPSGRTLGGSVWRIAVDMEEIVYAVDYNHGHERHLNPATLQKYFSRPAVLITDANNAQYDRATADTRPRREREMCDAVRDALRRDGNVLIPCDSACRVLELILVLENEWKLNRHMGSYKIALMGHMAISMLHQAQGLLEFMSEQIQTDNISTRANPFQVSKVTVRSTSVHTVHVPSI